MANNPQMHRLRGILGMLVLAACAAPAGPSESPAVAPSDAPASQAASTASASASAPASIQASAEPAATVVVDELARITVGNLTLRGGPSTAAEPLGALPVEAAALVVEGPVEADGYTWYRLASPGNPSVEWCAGEIPAFHCRPWIGWVAGLTPTGDRWIERLQPDCSSGRDTTSYLSMDTLTRFACAGADEWRLIAYIAAPGGRGCMPVWNVDPFWMDPSCSFFFPQPVERELDEETSLQGFIAPDLGICADKSCPELEGSWVEVVGHLDDPVAETCTSVLNSQIDEAPSPPPDPDLTVFRCRLNFVVTELTATTAPTP